MSFLRLGYKRGCDFYLIWQNIHAFLRLPCCQKIEPHVNSTWSPSSHLQVSNLRLWIILIHMADMHLSLQMSKMTHWIHEHYKIVVLNCYILSYILLHSSSNWDTMRRIFGFHVKWEIFGELNYVIWFGKQTARGQAWKHSPAGIHPGRRWRCLGRVAQTR